MSSKRQHNTRAFLVITQEFRSSDNGFKPAMPCGLFFVPGSDGIEGNDPDAGSICGVHARTDTNGTAGNAARRDMCIRSGSGTLSINFIFAW
jgi:hypothetical protein